MDKDIRLYSKRKMYSDRSALARIVDIVFLRVLILMGTFFILLVNTRNFTASVIVSILITVAVSAALSLWKKRRKKKVLMSEMQRIKRKCLLETLTLKDTDAFIAYANELLSGVRITHIEGAKAFGRYNGNPICVLHNHPAQAVGVEMILGVFRRFKKDGRITIVSLAALDENAEAFAAHIPAELNCICGEELLALAEEKGMMPSEQQAQELAREEMRAEALTIEKIRKNATQKAKTKGYVICGVLVMAWPLVTGFRFYHPLIAAACFALAYIAYRKGKNADKQADHTTS